MPGIGTFISAGRSLDDAVARAKRADELGFDSVYTTHIATRDSLTVLTAYAARDAELALEVIRTDRRVDAFYNSIFRNLVSHMVENPSTITSAAQLLFVARNLERIGDHATNVAEMVHFAATGHYPSDEER